MQNIWVLEFAFHLIKKIELGWLLGSQGRGADRHDNCSLLANHPEAGWGSGAGDMHAYVISLLEHWSHVPWRYLPPSYMTQTAEIDMRGNQEHAYYFVADW